jgi:hypothetical protein
MHLIGSKAPFSQLSKSTNRNELRSMIINKSLPNIYLTVSPNDTTHPLAYKCCLNDPNSFSFEATELTDAEFRAKQTVENPIGISEFFHVLISIILKHLFGWDGNNNNGILGILKSYYGMVELQNRGSLHIHMLIWLHGAPCPIDLYESLKTNEELRANMISYISKIIQTEVLPQSCLPSLSGQHNHSDLLESEECEIMKRIKENPNYIPFPDPTDEDFFHLTCHHVFQACATYQYHHHTFSCVKNPSIKGCRYRKPDKESEISEWNEETGQFYLKKSNGFVNNFNILILLLVNSNIDIQFLSSGVAGLAIAMYITDYITKSSVGIDSQYILAKAALQTRIDNPLKTGPMHESQFDF